jgi:SAM-dependent methyltransferase
MNVSSLPAPNLSNDPLRPDDRFWGPVRSYRNGVPLDVTEFRSEAGAGRPEACPVCADTGLSGIAVVYGYPVFECSGCRLGFVWPQPEAELLREYYRRSYWGAYLGDSKPVYQRDDIREHILRPQLKLARSLLSGIAQARILDVGAGDGSMLRLFRDAGFSRTLGIEFSAEVAEHARRVNGVDVAAVPEFSDFNQRGWDLITLWAVIEHLRSPLDYVAHANRLLKPGGWLLLMTGDNSSLLARMQGCFDMWMYPPEHLFFFDRASLRTLMSRGGFSRNFVRMGFQHPLKEVALWGLRLRAALRTRLSPKSRPFWRSTHSNLLAAGGQKDRGPRP